MCWPSLSVICGWGEDKRGGKEKVTIRGSKSADSTTICHLEPEKNQQRHVVHPPFQPLLQRDRPTVIHIDGCHHVFKHLHNKRKRFKPLCWQATSTVKEMMRWWRFMLVERRLNWSEFCYIPAEIISSSHHLSNYTIHFLMGTNGLIWEAKHKILTQLHWHV